MRTVSLSWGLMVGLYCAPPPPGPITRKSPGRWAQQLPSKEKNSAIRKLAAMLLSFTFRQKSANVNCGGRLPTCAAVASRRWPVKPESWPIDNRPQLNKLPHRAVKMDTSDTAPILHEQVLQVPFVKRTLR